VEESVFFEQTWDPGQVLSFVDPVHVTPGVYRAPFQFVLPPTAQPSIHTTPFAPGGGGLFSHRDGLSVEYALEARLKVPWWADLVVRAIIPIFSPHRVLGALPPLGSPPGQGQLTVAVGAPSPTLILPGGTLRVAFRVENPAGKTLRSLRLALTRVVEYQARGCSDIARSPTYVADHPLGGDAPSYAGTLEINVPNTEESTGPWQGRLYVTYWTAEVVLDVGLGSNVEISAPLLRA
jgi:hypothetical protein